MDNNIQVEERRNCGHESIVKNQSWIKGWLAAVSFVIVLGVPAVLSHASGTNASVGKMKEDISEMKADLKAFIAASKENQNNNRREMDEIKRDINKLKDKKQ